MAYSHNQTASAESTWKTKLFDLTFAPLYCQVSYHTPRPKKELSHQCTLDQWHTAQQTILMGFSKYRRSHTVIIFIILMNEKVFLFQCILKTKLLKLDLAPVWISHFAVTFRYLWMLTSYVTGGCYHISVVSECYGSPLTLV